VFFKANVLLQINPVERMENVDYARRDKKHFSAHVPIGL